MNKKSLFYNQLKHLKTHYTKTKLKQLPHSKIVFTRDIKYLHHNQKDSSPLVSMECALLCAEQQECVLPKLWET